MRTIVIGTAGHIDHGKSALVKALTGTDPDRLKEEQERGITIDLGFAHLALGDLQVSFVDVPGHERFVRNMLAGAGGIDAVLLVVAADESIMPQTREHFDICRLLGIDRGVIVLTKSDLVDADTLELAALEVRELVVGSFLQDAPILPVSSRTGAGLDALRSALQQLGQLPRRATRPGIARLPVDRVFSVKGFGTVVTGTLVCGAVHEGDELIVLPDGRSVRVRGVQVHGRPTADAAAPRRVALNLGSIEVSDLSRGVTLATPGAFSVNRRFDARISLVSGAKPLRHGARVRVHHGTDEVLGRVALAATRGPLDEEWTAVPVGARGIAIPAEGSGYARVRLERTAVFTRGDRVVIRSYSPPRTIGGGIVLDPEPPVSGVRRATTLKRFKQLDHDAEVAAIWLTEVGTRGMDATDLVRRGGLSPEQASERIDRLIASALAVNIGGRVFDARRVAEIGQRVTKELSRFHDAHPLETGMPREVVRELVAPGAPHELFESIVKRLVDNRIVGGTERLGLTARRPALDEKTVRAKETVEQLMREAGLTPPDSTSLQSTAGVPGTTLDEIVRLLVREHRLVRVGALTFHTDALARLRGDIQGMKSADPAKPAEIDVSTFKVRYGLSRKYAIPLLEWLDRERVTRRMGDRRVVL